MRAWRPCTAAPLLRAVHSWAPSLPMPSKAGVSVSAHSRRAPVRRLGSAAREGEDGVRVERGHCHITVPRLDLVLPLDALARRARQLSAGGRILPEPPGEAPADRRICCWLLPLQCANGVCCAWATGTEPDSAPASSTGVLGSAAAAKPAPPARQVPGAAGRFQWHRSGRAVGDAVELPAAPAGGEAPPWQRLMLRVHARLPQFASDHSIEA